jgi:hypothetical protein
MGGGETGIEDLDRALSDYDKAIELDPRDSVAYSTAASRMRSSGLNQVELCIVLADDLDVAAAMARVHRVRHGGLIAEGHVLLLATKLDLGYLAAGNPDLEAIPEEIAVP